MTRHWERPPFIVVTLTAAMIAGAAAFLGYAVLKVRNTATRIEILRDAYGNDALVRARLDRAKTETSDGRPGIYGRLFVTKENERDVHALLAAHEGVRVTSSDLDMREAQLIETAQAYLVPFYADLEGPFPAVTAYLNSLDRAPWLLLTDEVKISAARTASEPSRTKATVRGYIYWR